MKRIYLKFYDNGLWDYRGSGYEQSFEMPDEIANMLFLDDTNENLDLFFTKLYDNKLSSIDLEKEIEKLHNQMSGLMRSVGPSMTFITKRRLTKKEARGY